MKEIDELLKIMEMLRDQKEGCPWHKEQTNDSILPYTLEEIYELADAIYRKDMQGLSDELGDLLFHVVYYGQIASESGYFDFRLITKKLNEKLKRRHPHVFNQDSDATQKINDEHQSWWQIKAKEKKEEAASTEAQVSMLDDISHTLPGIIQANKLQRQAASVGFDWDSVNGALDKLQEEIDEMRRGISSARDKKYIMDELGDLLFSCVNIARHINVDPELALRHVNLKFIRRFRFMENVLKSRNKTLASISLDEMEELWQQAKKELGEV